MTARAVIPASVARDWAREWSALKEGRAAEWLAAVRNCYRSEPWKIAHDGLNEAPTLLLLARDVAAADR